MSIIVGHQALIRRVATMATSANIVLPNGPGAGLPRYVIRVVGGSQRTRTVDGTTEARPEIVVLVETGTEYVTENDTLVTALVQRFPVTAKFDGVTILNAPIPRRALIADGVYTVPVIINGFMSF